MSKIELAVIDIETTGLDPEKDMILEVGIVLAARDLTPIAEASWLVTSDAAVSGLNTTDMLAAQAPSHPGQEPWRGAQIVSEMHRKSRLAADVRGRNANGRKVSESEVAHTAAKFLAEYDVRPGRNWLPMTGSSVHFDRAFLAKRMPELEEMFHYRNIDVSTIKELAKIYRGDVADRVGAESKPLGLHRSLPDCRDTLGELGFYLSGIFAKGA